MVIERMVFNLKYGMEEQSSGLWNRMFELMPQSTANMKVPVRIYHSLTGRTSRVCQDMHIKSINDHNPLMYYWVINPRIQELYREFSVLCDSSQREMYKIEHEVGTIKNFQGTITERHTFHLHFGHAKPSISIWKQLLDENASGNGPYLRMLTDIVGPNYILIVEASYANKSDCTLGRSFWKASKTLNDLHAQFMEHCDSAELEYFLVDYEN